MKHKQLFSNLLILTAFSISFSIFAQASEAPKTAETTKKAATDKANPVYAEPIKGKIIEKIDAASYTYLKLKTKTDETWVAVPQLEISLNTEVELERPIPMFGFQSKTLKRKFDKIYFGLLKSQKEEMAALMKKNAIKK